VNFMLALNVTIYGLGIVFLALLVLMVAIMLLTKVFSVATGKDLLTVPMPSAPEAAPPPAAAPVAVAPAISEAAEPVIAPLPGKVLSVAVKAGNQVRRGDELCVIEAMKMGNSIRAQRDGTVRQVLVAPGQTVAFGASLLVLD
jgi:glutaconyl-CoA decarboxylase